VSATGTDNRAVAGGIAAFLAAVVVGGFPITAHAQDDRRPPPRPPESQSAPAGFIAEPDIIERVVIFGERRHAAGDLNSGFQWGLAEMVPGAGWAGGLVYRRWGKDDRQVMEISSALSARGYKIIEARYEMPRLARSRFAAGAQGKWLDYPRLTYFGQGPDSLEANVTEYGLRSFNAAGYGIYRPVRWLSVRGELGLLVPSVQSSENALERDRGDAAVAFAGDPVFASESQPKYLTAGISVTADSRDFPDHPLRGGLIHLSATRYSDRSTSESDARPSASFGRYEAEAAQFIPLAGDRVVLAAHGRLVSSLTDEDQFVPFYLQPSLGSHSQLRSYSDFRFHDRHLALVNVETRFALMTHVDAALFVDAGNVAARAADLNLLKRSYGAGLRLHSRHLTYLRLDVAHGDEGWRMFVRVTDPFQLSKPRRSTVLLPVLR
jgi:hypothetical protein